MSDSKISDLAAATALTGAELFAAVQGGANVKVTGTQVQTFVATTPTLVTPQGRLTLQSATPVMTADQSAKTTVYYAAYNGGYVPVWSGTAWELLAITSNQISMGLDAGVPHVASGSVYDVWAAKSGGVLVIGVGPAWTSTTARGTGAGTTEYELLNGILVNKNSLTNVWGGASGTTDYGAVSANRATLLGSLYGTAAGQTGFVFRPAAASGGSAPVMALSNAYNRVRVDARERDSATTWTYNSTTWRPLNGASSNVNNRVTFLDCLQQSHVSAHLQILLNVSGVNASIGINLDSTTAAPDISNQYGAGIVGANVVNSFGPQLGLHYVQAMECSVTGTSTFIANELTPTRNDQGMVVTLDY